MSPLSRMPASAEPRELVLAGAPSSESFRSVGQFHPARVCIDGLLATMKVFALLSEQGDMTACCVREHNQQPDTMDAGPAADLTGRLARRGQELRVAG